MPDESQNSGTAPPPFGKLTTVRAACAPTEVVDRLSKASRRGKLPGFRADAASNSFRVRLMGEPFDRELHGRAEPDGAGALVTLRERVNLLWPSLAALFCVVAIWPGVWLTDSMLETYWPWLTARVETWWWYIPLTAIPLPFALRTMWRRSAASAHEQRAKAESAIREALSA